MSLVRRLFDYWRDRFFLVMAGIALGLAVRSLFPPPHPEYPDLRKVKTPAVVRPDNSDK